MKKIITLLGLCFSAVLLNAEGSKQFVTNPLDTVNSCQLNVYSGSSGTGSIMNCPEFKRIYIHISDPATEKIDVGFKTNNVNRYYRIFYPNGTIFVPGTLIPTAGSVTGRIPFSLQNIQGPSNTLVTGGYLANVYTPTVAGDYWIEFNRDNNFTSPTLLSYAINLWDITVVKTTTSPFTPINGRVHCKTWNVFTGNAESMKALVYAYTSDSIIHKIDFNGMAGANWTCSMNSFGVTNTGAVASNRQSMFGDASNIDTLGQYPLFFNLPDTSYYQVTHVPLQLSFASAALTGCNASLQNISQCINVITNKPGVIELLINLNGVPGYQLNTADTIISYNVVPGTNCIPWNGVDGNGNFVSSGTSINLTCTIQIGITHIPLFDVEENPNGFIVQCILPTSIANTPLLYYDDTSLGAGSSLTGCASPCHTWSNTLGNNNTLNTWFFGTFVSQSTTVTGPSYAPQFNFVQSNPNCQGNLTNGSISYSAFSPYVFQPTDSVGIFQSPLTAPSSYQLVGPPYSFNNLGPGTYTIVIKNSLSCTYSNTITLIPIGVPTTSVAGPNQSLCLPLNSVALAANTATTGTGTWTQVSGPTGVVITNPASPTSTVTGVGTGIYIFQWTISSGTCPPSTSQVTITINSVPSVPAVSSNSPVCQGSSINLSVPSSPGATYSWTGPNGYTSSSQNPVISNATPLQAGTYSLVMTAGVCVSSQGTTTVVVNPIPATPTATNNSPLCSGNTINLNTPAVGGVNYTWTGPASFTSPLQNPSISNSTVAMSGTYSVTITNTATGCSSLAGTTTVVVNPTPTTPIVTSNSPVCEGFTLVVISSSTAGATYSWTGPNSFTSSSQNLNIPNITTLQAGTYSVIATLGTCSSVAGTITVVVNPLPPTPVASSNSPVCAGDTLQLITPATSGFTYSWTGPGGYASGLSNPNRPNSTIAMAGTYTLTVRSVITGCTSLPGTTLVVINPAPAVPTANSNSPVCIGNAINLTTPVASGSDYSWTGPNGFSSSSQNPNIPNSTLAMAGTYSLTVTNTTTGCTSIAGTVDVIVNPTPTVPTTGSNTPVCEGATLNLTAASIAGSTYNWTGPNSYSSNTQNPSIAGVTMLQAGTYSVTASIGTCISQVATTIVVINPAPATPTATNNTPLCAGNTINLNTPTGSGVSYGWTGPNAFTSPLQNPSILNSTVAMSGIYSVIVTNTITGCPSLAGTTTVVVNPTPTTPVVSSNTPVCVGSTLNLTAASTAGATYSWTGPNSYTSSSQNPSITNVASLQAGTYSVVATLGTCGSTTGTTTVVVNPLPATPSAANNTPICAGDTIKLNTPVTGGFTYTWTGPSGFSSALQNPDRPNSTVAMAGTYSLTVTNSTTGCTSLAGTTLVVINPLPATPVVNSNSPVCTGNTINLTTPSASGSDYSWTGPNGFTSLSQNPSIPNATLVMAGTYNLTITNTTTGCSSIAGTVNVIVNDTPPAPTSGSNTPVCEGATLNLTAASTSGSTYNWTGPNSYSSNTQNPSITGITVLQAGTYSVTATLSGCTSPEGTTIVVVNALPATPVASNNTPICAGDTIHLSTTAVFSSYTWTGPGGFSNATQNPNIPNSTMAMSGTYSVTVTDLATGCSSLAGTTSVTINATPVIPVVSSNSPVCVGATVNLTSASSPGSSYSWTGPNSYTSSSQNPSITNVSLAEAGTYSVSATIGTCSSPFGTVSVIVNALPATPILTSNSPVCAGDSLQLSTATLTNFTYSWTGPNSFSSGLQNPTIPNANLTMAGTYSLTITDGTTSCTSLTGSNTVVVNAIPATPTASNNSPLCVGDTLHLNTPNISGVSFNWSGPLSFSSSVQNPVVANSSIPMSGNYNVTITDSITGCTSLSGTTVVLVNVIPSILTVGSNSTLCIGATLNLSVTSVLGAGFHWTGPNSYSSSTQNPSISPVALTDAGTYSVYATLGTCTSSVFSTNVVINALPTTPTISSNSPVCLGSSINLSAGANPNYSYSWTGPNSFVSIVDNPTIPNSTTAMAGTYSVIVTDNTTTCTSLAGTTTVVINALPPAPSAGNNSPVCDGSAINFNTSVTGVTYSWSGPNGFTSVLQNPGIATSNLSSAGTYSLTITDNTTGCTSPAGTTIVSIFSLPATPNATSNSPVCNEESIHLNTTASSGLNYSWVGPNGFSSSIENPIIPNASDAMEGIYVLVVTDATTGCTSAADATEVLIHCPTIVNLVVPNIFSPNGDGTNDFFSIDTKGVKLLTGEIYDRWGVKMFSWQSVSDKWNGQNLKGQNVPEGTYFYIIKATGYDDSEKDEKGFVMLVR